MEDETTTAPESTGGAAPSADIRRGLQNRRPPRPASTGAPSASAPSAPAPGAPAPAPAAPAAPQREPLSAPVQGAPAKKKSGAQRRKEGRQLTREVFVGARGARGAEELRAAADRAEAAKAAQLRAEAAARMATPQGRRAAAAGLGGCLGFVFNLIAMRKGAHWKLSADEQRDLGESAADAFGDALPILAEHGPKIMFGGALVGAIMARSEQDALGPGAPAPAPSAPAPRAPESPAPAPRVDFIGDIT